MWSDQLRRRRTSQVSSALLGNALLVAATPLLTWWLIGDLSESPTADYYLLPPARWNVGDEEVVGLVAAVLAIAGLLLVVGSGPLRERRLCQWHAALGLILIAEVIAVLSYRLFTAGTVGANISGGFAILIGFPAVGALLACAWRRLSVGGEWRPQVGRAALAFFAANFLLGMVSLWFALVPIVLAVVAATSKLELRVSRGGGW